MFSLVYASQNMGGRPGYQRRYAGRWGKQLLSSIIVWLFLVFVPYRPLLERTFQKPHALDSVALEKQATSIKRGGCTETLLLPRQNSIR